MKNHYFVGFASGKQKKDPSKMWYAINTFGENRFGNLDIVPVFLKDKEEYDRLVAEAPPLYSAVTITCDQFGSVLEFKAVDGVPKLNCQ